MEKDPATLNDIRELLGSIRAGIFVIVLILAGVIGWLLATHK